jgi:hypothetical protein
VQLFENTRCGGNSRPTNSSGQEAVVEYDSHRSAAIARKYLFSYIRKLWGRQIFVDWAKPKSHSKVSPIPPNTQITANVIRDMAFYSNCDKIAKG